MARHTITTLKFNFPIRAPDTGALLVLKSRRVLKNVALGTCTCPVDEHARDETGVLIATATIHYHNHQPQPSYDRTWARTIESSRIGQVQSNLHESGTYNRIVTNRIVKHMI